MSLSISTVISYKDALSDWVESNWDELIQEYRIKFGVLPSEEDWDGWASFCQRQFDDRMSIVEDHNPLEDR